MTSGTCPTHNPTILTNNRIAELSYDAAGNVTADGSFTYQWDAESRLKSLNTSAAIYAYDAAGMRVRKAVGGNATEYIYFNGQVIAERSAGGNWTDYVYAGSRLVARSDPVVVRFTNDSCSACGGPPVGGGDRNLFVNSITIGSTTILPSDPTVSYTGAPCNGNNNGVGWLLCDGDMISSSVAAGGSITVNAYGSPDYNIYPHMQLWVNGVLAGEWDVTGTAQNYTVTSTVPGAQYYYADHLGSTRVVTNSAGAVLWSYDYMPFGEGATADYLVNRLFTGHERDPESGLDHTWFRQYSSGQGRWLSPDPLAGSADNPQSLNRYAYVRSNPVNLVDPLGLEWACTTTQGPNGPETECTWYPDDNDGAPDDVKPGETRRCFYTTPHIWGAMGGPGTVLFCPPRGASTLGGEVDPPGLSRALERFGGRVVNAHTQAAHYVADAATGYCASVSDAASVGGGADFGFGSADGVQTGLIANGRNGDLTFFASNIQSGGVISPDAYVFTGLVPNAPNNHTGTDGGQSGGAVAVRRLGGAVSSGPPGTGASSNHYQVTFGVSLLPFTFAAQTSRTTNTVTVPFVGYILHPVRAGCAAVTGR